MKSGALDILVNIEAAERSGGKLLFRNAGTLFFARDPRRFFNQAYVACLLFKGTSKAHVLDRKDFAGGVVADIKEGLRFIERNTRTAYRIEKLQREEIPEYPVAALCETITNAVMHRDWFVEGANVFVEIFEDRIEISNPGGLPKGMQPKAPGFKSVRRNPLIADLLHRIAFIEKAGTGIRRMREGARDQGYPEPEFSDGIFFNAIFRPIVPAAGHEAAHDEAHDEAHEALESTVHVPYKHPTSTAQAIPQVTPQVTPQATPQVTQQELALLRVAIQESSAAALQSALCLKDRVHFLKKYLEPALEKRLIERTIPDKPRSPKQRYRTTVAGRSFLESSGKESQS